MSFLKSFFADLFRVIRCPFCQVEQSLSPGVGNKSGGAGAPKGTTGQRCSNPKCARDLPHQFLARYKEAPALFMPMMGWTGAGKTTFLIMATVMLDRAVHIWDDYSFEALTDETIRSVREARDAVVKRRLPAPTPMSVKDTYLCHLLGMPRWGSRSWIVRDVPGEHFQTFSIPEEQTSFVGKAKTVLLFVDLAGHLEEAGAVAERRGGGMSIDELLKCYTNSLGNQGQTFEKGHGRKVIVILTKANHLPGLPENLRSYLERDELQPLLLTDGNRKRLTDYDMASYMERLARVSIEIREWLSTQPGGEALLRHAKLTDIELRFCMIAAIPSGVDRENVPLGQLDPHRILDPLFWALELNSVPRSVVQSQAAPRA